MQAKCMQIFQDVISYSYKTCHTPSVLRLKTKFTACESDCFKMGNELFSGGLYWISAYCSNEYLARISSYEMSVAFVSIGSLNGREEIIKTEASAFAPSHVQYCSLPISVCVLGGRVGWRGWDDKQKLSIHMRYSDLSGFQNTYKMKTWWRK